MKVVDFGFNIPVNISGKHFKNVNYEGETSISPFSEQRRHRKFIEKNTYSQKIKSVLLTGLLQSETFEFAN